MAIYPYLMSKSHTSDSKPAVIRGSGLFILTVTHAALSEQLLFASLSLWDTESTEGSHSLLVRSDKYVNHLLKFE